MGTGFGQQTMGIFQFIPRVHKAQNTRFIKRRKHQNQASPLGIDRDPPFAFFVQTSLQAPSPQERQFLGPAMDLAIRGPTAGTAPTAHLEEFVGRSGNSHQFGVWLEGLERLDVL